MVERSLRASSQTRSVAQNRERARKLREMAAALDRQEHWALLMKLAEACDDGRPSGEARATKKSPWF